MSYLYLLIDVCIYIMMSIFDTLCINQFCIKSVLFDIKKVCNDELNLKLSSLNLVLICGLLVNEDNFTLFHTYKTMQQVFNS